MVDETMLCNSRGRTLRSVRRGCCLCRVGFVVYLAHPPRLATRYHEALCTCCKLRRCENQETRWRLEPDIVRRGIACDMFSRFRTCGANGFHLFLKSSELLVFNNLSKIAQFDQLLNLNCSTRISGKSTQRSKSTQRLQK